MSNNTVIKLGNWLFKYRSFVPILVFPFYIMLTYAGVIEVPEYVVSNTFFVCCLMVCFTGILIRAWVVLSTPAGTSGRNRQKQIADTLNTKGIYSLTRNPLYLGNYLMWLGLLMFTGNIWFIAFGSIFFFTYYYLIIQAETNFLKNKFGQQYIDWCNETPVFFPKFWGYQNAENTMPLRFVFRREHSGWLAIIVVFFILDVYHRMLLNTMPQFNILIAVILSIVLIHTVIIKLFKHSQYFQLNVL